MRIERLQLVLALCVGNILLILGIAYLWYPQLKPLVSGGDVQDVSYTQMETPPPPASESPTDTSVSVASTSTPDVPSQQQSDALPAEVHLAVPFTSQAPEGNWDEPWQDACEEAAILMLDAYYKHYSLSPLFARDELQKMVDWETARSFGYSIPVSDIETVAAWYMGDSFSFTAVHDPTVEELKRALADGHPVLVVAAGQTLDNPYFSGDGPVYHALVLRGYTPDGFITNDPGTKHGESFFYTYDNLMGSIHDWNAGDVGEGERVVLVPVPAQ